MSLVQPADLVEILPGLTDPQLQVLIDRAEAAVAERIGFQAYFEDPDIDEGETTGELGERTIDQTFLVQVRYTNTFELPLGPWITWTSLQVGSLTIDFTDLNMIKMRPWSLKWVDPSKYFTGGEKVAVQGTIGWNVGNLPDRVRQAVYQSVAAYATSTAAMGSLATPAVKSEKSGPFSTTFETGGASEASAKLNSRDIDSVDRLLINWRRPDDGI